MKPRKHAELIKAWADGAEIEYKMSIRDEWVLCEDPCWYEDVTYRIKEPPLKYRVALLWFSSEKNRKMLGFTRTEWQGRDLENSPHFIKWATPWMEASECYSTKS